MDKDKIAKLVIGLSAILAFGAWSTSTIAATAEERAKCEAMFKDMGVATHEHTQPKAPPGPDPMTAEHRRCKEILATPANTDHTATPPPNPEQK